MDFEGKILVVDDDKRLVKMIEEYLNLCRFKVVKAYSGKDALAFCDETIDLIILDINMNHFDGIQVCEKVRQNFDVPVIFLSANTASYDKIRAFGVGGDDYVIKPFDPMELIARIKAHIGRARRYSPSKYENKTITFADIKIYKDAHKILKQDKEIKLSKTEFKLLIYLVEHPFIVLSRKEILKNVWNSQLYDEAIVNTYIKRIRQKLERNNEGKQYIRSVRGIGYMFEAESDKNF
ncbi:DNA-binding response regulator, OmpR family, contains REC and winged-helix (wHTH) domain [Anaerovirgula multivorans]|uniref:Stage 0 sporulation protein A homolog n=1 Tax=Anaerovirgula multivorans TaxID=312168 RepID=A0A239DFR5_9FIRM|nr:response regulator transcription factor [Anaerovirgula multivorans]SNS30674.1 DNA-binding response regulator, OmpR family, contains REC and winged-helix (wHTH) domain [Anaerovirgula multivorans]